MRLPNSVHLCCCCSAEQRLRSKPAVGPATQWPAPGPSPPQLSRGAARPPSVPQDFTCGGDKFQDGAVTANNPAVIALQEAVSAGCARWQAGRPPLPAPAAIHPRLASAPRLQRLLWPDHPIDVLLSVGVGVSPAVRRDKGLSTFMETGAHACCAQGLQQYAPLVALVH